MADSNVQAYRNAEADLVALIAMLNEQAMQTRGNSEGLLKFLWPELVGHDKEVIGDIALRRIIAQVHAEALSGTIDGWIDDVIALSRPWEFKTLRYNRTSKTMDRRKRCFLACQPYVLVEESNSSLGA